MITPCWWWVCGSAEKTLTMATALNTRRIWTSLLALTALIAGGAAAATALEEPLPPEADFYYVGDDDIRAAQLLHDCMKRNPVFESVETRGESVVAKLPTGYYFFRLATFRTLSDRIIMTEFFRGTPGNQNDCAALQLINEINDGQNQVKFSWDKDGDLRAQTSIAFDNLLTGEQLDDHIAFHLFTMLSVIEDHGDALDRFTGSRQALD